MFYRFFAWQFIAQDEYVDNWHIPELCNILEEYKTAIVERKHIDDLIVNIAPGSSKSSIFSQTFPVWLWFHDPSISILVSSYSSGLSTDHSLKAKSIIQNDIFDTMFQSYFIWKFGKKISFVKNNEGDWVNNFGGRYMTTSTCGTATGRHAHVVIRDDPENPEEAFSDAYRIRANRFNDRTLSTRKKNKGITPTITVMQILHPDDTTGHELKKNKIINHICLPAELTENVKPEKYKENYIDGLFDPVRMSREILEGAKNDLGSYGFATQFLQQSYVEGGGLVKKEWFCFIEYSEMPEVIVWDLWIDGAYTNDKANDPTGLMIIGHDYINKRLVVKHALSEWLVIPELLTLIPKYIKEHGGNAASRVFIEPKASGYDLINMLRSETYLNVKKITGKLVSQGKVAKVNAAAPRIESNMAFLRAGWNDEVVAQLTGSPNYPHDEYCDLLGYASHYYFKN